MAFSKALKAPHLFTMKASGTDDLSGGTAFLSSVNSGALTNPGLQWKMKELLFTRSLTGAVDLVVKLVDSVTGAKHTIAEVLAFTTNSARIASNLSNGEYLFDADSELEVTSANLGVAETWNLRITGQIVGKGE